jgi:membrane protein required for colicin V production
MQAPPSAVTFTAFDWFLILILAVSTLAAFQKGIIRVLLSLGGLIAGIMIASWNYETLAVSLERSIHDVVLADVIAFLAILGLILVLFSFVAKALSNTIKAIGLGFVDRLLGAVFGFARGVLLGIAAMMLAAAFFPQALWLQNSALSPYFLDGVHAVSFVVPAHFQEQISVGAKYLLHQTPEFFRPRTLTRNR